MAVTLNPATCEVTVDLGGKSFRLHATMPRVAEFEASIGARNIKGVMEALAESRTKAVYEGLRCLCVSGNDAELDSLLFGPNVGDAVAALFKALTAGLPDPEPSRGNARATTTKTRERRGRDTGSSPSA